MINENDALRDGTEWVASSFSNGGGACVQVKFAKSGAVLVRDSKDRRAAYPMVSVPSYSWASMLKNLSNPS